MTPYVQLVCVASTAFCLVAVAADLYVMVVRATGPSAQLHGGRTRKTAIHLFIVWMAAIIYSARIFIDLLKPSAGGDFDLDADEGGSHGEEHDDDDDDDDEECMLFIETDTDDIWGRCVDFALLYVLPIAVQIFFYVKVARKLWSSRVS